MSLSSHERRGIQGRVATRRRRWLDTRLQLGAALLVGMVLGCGGKEDSARAVATLTPRATCDQWREASAPAQTQLANQLRRGNQDVALRRTQIEDACRRYGATTAVADALDMLARDEHVGS